MRLGWLTDPVGYVGGAELTQQEFRAAAPEGVEIIDCPPGAVEVGLDGYVANNVVHYTAEDIVQTDGALIWYHHDLSPWIRSEVREWLDVRATHIYCSPAQRDRYGTSGPCIPPALDLDRYRPTRQAKRNREGAVSIAQWRNPGKGAQRIVEWAAENEPIDVYGPGDFIPAGDGIDYRGELAADGVASVLLNYATFVFLPTELEPFCRTVAEAWASGCRLVVNRQIGALWWITEAPEKLQTAAENFWEAVEAAAWST